MDLLLLTQLTGDTVAPASSDSLRWSIRILGDTIDNWITVVLTAVLIAITAYYARKGHQLQQALHDLENKRDEDARTLGAEKQRAADARVAASAYAVRASLAPLDAEAIIVKAKGRQLPAFARKFREQIQALLTSLMQATVDATEGSESIRHYVSIALVALARARGALDFIDLFSRVDIEESDAEDVAMRDGLVTNTFAGLSEQLHACYDALGNTLTPELREAEKDYRDVATSLAQRDARPPDQAPIRGDAT